MNTFFRVLVAAILTLMGLLSSANSLAQAQPQPQTPPSQQQDLQPLTPEQMRAITEGTASSLETVRILFRAVDRVLLNFARGSTDFASLGRRITVALLLVILAFGIIKSWVIGQGMGQLLPDFIQPLIVAGLTLWAIPNLAPVVADSVKGLSAAFSHSVGSDARIPDEVDIVAGLAGSGFELIAAGPQGQGWGSVTDKILSFGGRCLAALALILAGVIGAGTMLLGKFQVAIAVLFAPVMIPWAAWRQTTFLFNAWLSFLIGGAMQTVLSGGLAAMLIPVVNQLATISASARAGTTASYTMMLVIILVSLFVAFLMARATPMSNALVGSASIGVEGWASMAKSLTSGVSNALKLAGGAASGTVKAGYEFGKGVQGGMSSAQGNGSSSSRATGAGASSHKPSVAQAAGQRVGASMARSSAKASGGYPKTPPAPAPAPSATPSTPAHRPMRPNPTRRPVNRPKAVQT